MKPESYRRDTAFLYPDLETCTPEQRIQTLELITRITAIVTAANSELAELVDGGNFSYVNCMPEVYMECVSDASISTEDYENVRICVAKFDQFDYLPCYKSLTNAYQSGITKISHLVALCITRHQQKAVFSKDEAGYFDSIITTSLDQLESILVSILFDISIYHYFGLSNNLSDRKKFNEIKYQYLLHKYDQKYQIDNYGRAFPTSPIYLPLSLPEVKTLNRRTKRESRQEIVIQMLNKFATFLSESLMAVHVMKDADGYIMNPSSVPLNLRDHMEKIVYDKKDLQKFFVVFLENSTGNLTSKVLKYPEKGGLACWIEKGDELQTFYKIVLVKQGGDET